MNLHSLIFLAFALCFDSATVATIIGMTLHNSKEYHLRRLFRFCLCLAVAQGLMPIIGWIVASKFRSQIEEYDHWVAFGLLVILGIKMIIDSLRKDDSNQTNGTNCFLELTSIPKSILFGLATSIDALIIGVSMALVDLHFINSSQTMNMLFGGFVIAVTTFLCSTIGTGIGIVFGKGIGNKANIIGGLILILIGCKILLEHTI